MEELIKFETARKAKDKKFDILCEHDSGIQENNQNGFRDWNKEYKNSYSRPTQSVLAKWLRENHNIDVFLDSVGGRSGYYYVLQYVDSGNQIKTGDTYHIFEEAYEKGLFEALNLLEDVN
jgi:hypothetical protein